jgi:hypothetical protein
MSKFLKFAAEYRRDFIVRSGGYDFPEIDYIGTWENTSHDLSPLITASMPICNQEGLIQDVLKSFFLYAQTPTQLVLCLDACRDGTEGQVKDFLDSVNPSETKVIQVVMFRTNVDIFESSSDNFILSLTETPYFLTIQADNFLNDPSFLPRAIQAMELFPDISGLSARGVVPFDHPRRRPHRESRLRQVINLPSRFFPKFFRIKYLGPFGSRYNFFGDISTPPHSKLAFSSKASRCAYLGEVVVRGPILWKSQDLKKCNGFNDIAYFLGWDDYDLCYRLFKDHKLRVGFLPSSSYSLVNTGTNSFPRSTETQLEYDRRERLASENIGAIDDFWNLRDDSEIEIECDWERRYF